MNNPMDILFIADFVYKGPTTTQRHYHARSRYTQYIMKINVRRLMRKHVVHQ